MQPVRGTLPSDRRKSCPALAGPRQPLGSGPSGGLRESELSLPRLQAPCPPPQLPEQGPPSPAVGPQGPSPSPSPEVSDPAMLSWAETPRKPGVYFVPTSKPVNPPPPLAVPGWQLWPTPQPGIPFLSQLDGERPSSSSSNLSLVFLFQSRDQTPEKEARAAWTPSL